MPTTRKPLVRRRRAKPTAHELWQAGRYIEAVATEPLIEFLYVDHVMSHDEIVAAAELREHMEAKATRISRRCAPTR